MVTGQKSILGDQALDLTGSGLSARLRAVFDEGRLIALPTETVYGLAAPIDRPELVRRIFELKGRPANNPLIVHVGSVDQARRLTSAWPEVAERLAKAFWPGPLTLVLPRSARIVDAITAGRDTVALRMPDHPVALAILRALDVPLVAPSANLFTRLSPTCAEDVRAAFPAEQVEVIDGGACRIGIESTIVAIDSAQRTVTWLRPGQVERADIVRQLPTGWRLEVPASVDEEAGARQAPGRMREHYRPQRPLHVHVCSGRATLERVRAELRQDPQCQILELPESADAAARSLYRQLREADRQAVSKIALLLDAENEFNPRWEGVINRLRKAASMWCRHGD